MNKSFDKKELDKLYKYFLQAYYELDTAYGELMKFTIGNNIDYSKWLDIKCCFINTDSEFLKLLDEVEKFCKEHSGELNENHS